MENHRSVDNKNFENHVNMYACDKHAIKVYNVGSYTGCQLDWPTQLTRYTSEHLMACKIDSPCDYDASNTQSHHNQ